MLPTAASLSAALSTTAEELEAAPELDGLDELDGLEELEELDEPEDPELEEVDAEDEAVDELDSPALSVDVCDAVSQAATKKATAASAIRRCNMVMLPVFNPGLLAIRLSGGCPMNSLFSPRWRHSCRSTDRLRVCANGRMKTSLVVPGTPGPTNLVTY